VVIFLYNVAEVQRAQGREEEVRAMDERAWAIEARNEKGES
jgi:hypothetical protein